MKIRPYMVHLATFLTWVFILTASLIPHPPEVMHPFSYSDKLFHALAYLVFTVFAGFSWKIELDHQNRSFSLISGLLILVLPILAMGGVIEIIQPYFSRSREFLDFAADALGTTTGFIIIRKIL